jgi:nicotinate-nucleotide adenylyltransferase
VTAKTGILGGSFDPPHVGHVAMARAAIDTLGLDKVLLMPAHRPPHKDAADVSDWGHRLAMAKLAAREVDRVEVSPDERQTPGASFTVELLRRYRAAHDDELYFIMGADSLRDLPGWREPDVIVELATLVVFPRAGIEPVLAVDGDARIVVFDTPVIDVSSSEIRRKRRDGDSIRSLVPGSVLEYIEDHSLYTR